MDLSVHIKGEDTLTPKIEQAKKALNELEGPTKRLEKIREVFDNINNSAAPMQRKLASVKKLIAEMNFDGLNNTELFTEIAQKAGQYADAIGDASTAVRKFSDDNFKLKAACEGLQAITATATLATGAMNLFGIENEKTNEAILKVQSALAVLNGVQTLSNLLNKDSALMLGLKSAATVGATITTTSFTAALSKQALVESLVTLKQKISTAAQIAWNVAKAIGMAMLGNFTGLALLAVGAIVGITMATRDDTEATEENTDAKERQKNAVEQLKEKQQEAHETLVKEEAKVIASYQAMSTQWKNLTSEQEKSKWIEDNKNKFQQLGWAINNVMDAEDFFSRSSAKVIAALKARADAAAYYELYVDALKKKYELDNTKLTFTPIDPKDKDAAKKQKEEIYQKTYQLGEDRRAANDNVERLKQKLVEAQQAADKAIVEIPQLNVTTNKTEQKTSSTKREEKVKLTWEMDDGTLKFAEDYAKQLKEDYEKIPVGVEYQDVREKMRSALDAIQKEVESRKLVLYPEVEFPEGSLDYAKAMLQQAEDILPTLDLKVITPEQLEEALSQVEHWKQEVEKREIELGIRVKPEEESVASIVEQIKKTTFEKGSVEDKRQSYQNANNILNQIKTDYSIGIIGADEALEQIANLNTQLEELGLKPYEFVINAETGELDEAMTKLEEMQANLAMAQQNISEYQGLFTEMGGALSGIGGLFDDNAQKMLDFAGTTLQAISQMLPQLLALFGNKAAIAMVSGIESASSLPFPANLAAIATVVSTLTAVIAKAASMKNKKFATGGIVQGRTTIGDYETINVNGGEMILNGRQQAKLFRLLSSNTTAYQQNISKPVSMMTNNITSSISNSSTQSFSNGGIVNGTTTIGDYNLAKINKGEMILNGSQQHKLFKIINEHQNQEPNGVPSYTVKIKGSDLHLAMSNYAKTKKNIMK